MAVSPQPHKQKKLIVALCGWGLGVGDVGGVFFGLGRTEQRLLGGVMLGCAGGVCVGGGGGFMKGGGSLGWGGGALPQGGM